MEGENGCVSYCERVTYCSPHQTLIFDNPRMARGGLKDLKAADMTMTGLQQHLSIYHIIVIADSSHHKTIFARRDISLALFNPSSFYLHNRSALLSAFFFGVG